MTFEWEPLSMKITHRNRTTAYTNTTLGSVLQKLAGTRWALGSVLGNWTVLYKDAILGWAFLAENTKLPVFPEFWVIQNYS
jgi:hypothetical protein